MGGLLGRVFGGRGGNNNGGGANRETTGGQSGPSKVTDQDKAILV